MIRAGILVEGQTEVLFVNQVLYHHLISKEIVLIPVNLYGRISVHRIVDSIVAIRSSFNYVTTLVDYYGFSRKRRESNCQLIARIKNQLKAKGVDNESLNYIFPYIQMHEFESLLFSIVDALAQFSLFAKNEIRALAFIT